jgi:AmmeMemoRadiSam system protein B
MKRAATHAGTWYSSNPNTLSQQLSIWIDQAIEDGHGPIKEPSVLIAPHAGYSYSGPTAGFAYSSLLNEATLNTVETVFLLGPSHHARLELEAALSSCDVYETPVGPIQVDRSITNSLFKSGLFTWMSLQLDQDEHSLEMHLPYIRHCFSGKGVTDDTADCKIKLVPILIGCPTLEQERSIAALLKPYFEDKKCVFIISSDFCHWGSRFNFVDQRGDGSVPIYEFIEKLDKAGMSLIEDQGTVID